MFVIPAALCRAMPESVEIESEDITEALKSRAINKFNEIQTKNFVFTESWRSFFFINVLEFIYNRKLKYWNKRFSLQLNS